MDLSLVVPYRNREPHLRTMLAWFAITSSINSNIELIIIESSKTPSLHDFSSRERVKYVHVPAEGNFNKSKLLNIGLQHAKGLYIGQIDVDLVPVDLSFSIHLNLAKKNGNGLVTGYRLLYDKETISADEIGDAMLSAKVAVEDCSAKFLRMQLVEKQRFGILPIFGASRLHEIGGWDEQFEGWGGEDQEVIERYLSDGSHFLRCPDLIYIHLHHEKSEGWDDPDLISKNLERYLSIRTKRAS